MTYIVVSENEIVKAEMERPGEPLPEFLYDTRKRDYIYDTFRYKKKLKAWENHCLSLPRIPIRGEHNWKVWQEVEEGKDFYLMDTDKWYWCKCEKCGWEGSSQLCKGGGPIADTGDYDDALCPECMSNDLDGETDNGPEDYTSIVAIPIEQTKSEQGDDVKEYILCAAIWYKDDNNHQHQPKNIQSGFVVCGRRHHNCFMVASICLAENYSSVKGTAKQGFITNLDRFVDRREAGMIAFNANQINEPTDCLFSEDLY